MPLISICLTTDNTQLWQTSRDSSAPGSGVWAAQTKIADTGAGTLLWSTTLTGGPTTVDLASSHLGLCCPGQVGANSGLFFVGNGGTPQFISAFSSSGLLSNIFAYEGAWFINNAYYLAVVNNNFGASHRLSVIKSSDGGATWAEMDSSNAPNYAGQTAHWTVRRQATVLYTVVGAPADIFAHTGDIKLTDFDFTTETWGASYAALTLSIPIGGGSGYNLQNGDSIVHFPNGDRGIFYATTNGHNYTLFYRLYSSGSWGAAVSLVNDTNTQFASVLLDPSGELMHVFRYIEADTEAPDSYRLVYSTVTHSGTYSGDLFTFPIGNAPFGTSPTGNGVIKDGNIYITYSQNNGSPHGVGDFTVWSGVIGSNTFTAETLPTFANASAQAYLLIEPDIPALSITCPIGSDTATVGTPFTSNAPVVTGGTAPYAFVLISGPGWMSINASTGVVSGTPTAAGTFTYVIQVTDSLGSVATTDPGCGLAVSGMMGLPCDSVVPQSTDVRFRLEKVMATIRQDAHLPVRGSVQ